MFKLISSILLYFFIVFAVQAEEIREIRVINNDRISKDTIQIFSNIQIGESYDQNDLNRILKDIYDTNFFSDVSLEIKNGVLTKHESIQSMAHEIGCSVNTLSQTLNDWNKIVDTKDDTLGRPIIGNEQIQDAPYYVGKLYPVVGNTQGGPKTNHHRQVLDAF